MVVKEKIELYHNMYGWCWLKRWDSKEGFYVEWIPNIENGVPEIYSEGLTLQKCISGITDECPFDRKILFSNHLNDIIETFSLTDDEKKYLIELNERYNF